MAAPGDGILIAVEGIDGVGKTTLVARLRDALTSSGEPVTCSKEPTSGAWGTKIRRSAANGRMTLEEELRAFIEDRREHVANIIKPALSRGEIVILDRYFYSTIAYQGERGADIDLLAADMRSEFPIPDVAILLDAEPAVTVKRISQLRGDIPNEFERLESLEHIRQIFLAMRPICPEMRTIDAHRSVQDVYLEAAHLLLETALKAKRCAKSYDCDIFYCAYRIAGQCRWATLSRQLPQARPVGPPAPATQNYDTTQLAKPGGRGTMAGG